MAVTTETDQIHSVRPPVNGSEPPPPSKRPRGRPSKCRQCGEPIDPTVAHVCPPVPDAFDSATMDEGADDFWLMLSNFSIDEWQHLSAYLYRVAPMIDRKSKGQATNIQIFSTAFTVDDIKREHGSGVYRIDLNQSDPASNRSRRISRKVFTIIDPKFPPVVPPGDWVDDKINDMWKWGAPAGSVSSAGIAAGYPPGFDMEKVLGRTEQGLRMGLEMAKQMAPAAKDTSGTDALLLKLLEAMLNRPEPPKDTSMALIVELLRADLKEARDEMRELRKVQTAPPSPQKNLIEQIKEIQPTITGFMEMMGKGDARPWYESLAEKAVESIPDIIDIVKTGQANGQRQQQPAAGWTNQQQLPAAQQNNPPASVAPATGQPAAAPADLTDEQKEQQRINAIYQKWGGFIMFVAPKMIEEFRLDHDDDGGGHFRDWLIRMHGELRWSDMKRELGPDLLSQMIASHPQLSVDMAPEEARLAFIDEFFAPEELEDLPEEGAINLGGEDDAA